MTSSIDAVSGASTVKLEPPTCESCHSPSGFLMRTSALSPAPRKAVEFLGYLVQPDVLMQKE